MTKKQSYQKKYNQLVSNIDSIKHIVAEKVAKEAYYELVTPEPQSTYGKIRKRCFKEIIPLLNLALKAAKNGNNIYEEQKKDKQEGKEND